MKLIYKIGGLTLVSGASVASYLLIPPSTLVEDKEQVVNLSKAKGAWKKEFEKQGYRPVVMSQPWELVPRLLETFKKVKKIEDGQESEELRKLCNSFEEKESLSTEEDKEAKRWCVEPKEIENIVKGKGRKFIYTSQDGVIRWDEQKLKTLAKKYLSNQKENLKMETSWDNAEALVISDKDTEGNLESFKKACENVLVTRSFEENLENKINQAIEWCTED